MDKNIRTIPMTRFEIKRDSIERTLTEEEIDNFLEDYVHIQDPLTIPIDSYVRYFNISFINGKASKVFRLGGKLYSISPDGDYLVIKSGPNVIQVPVKNTIFYKQLTIAEIKDEYEDILDEYEDEISKLKKKNIKLLSQLTGKDESIKGRSHARMIKLNSLTQSIVKHDDSESDTESESDEQTKSVRRSRMSTTNKSNTVPPSKRELMSAMQIRL